MWKSKSEGAIYQVDQMSGQGRTARVFRAVRQDSRGHSRQTVALKILRDETSVPWLRREFETLAKVDSRYCVRVLGWENLREGSALVLEWIDGVNLLELARGWELEADLVEEIIAQVQEGLRALSRCGLHHGDLSPTNILIDKTGMVKIVDFGTLPPSAGVFHGTPRYMAPELWEGVSANLSSDLFALGLIQYDLQTSFQRWRRPAASSHRSVEEVRTIAQSHASPLLDMCASRRHMLDLRSLKERQERLAMGVKHIQASRTSVLMRTLIQAGELTALSWLRRLFMSVAVITIAAMAPGRAQAPLLEPNELPSACLRVRSLHWIHLSIDNQDIGYAPKEVKYLKSGMHEIRWRSHRSAGQKRIFLRPGRCIELRDVDFGLPH